MKKRIILAVLCAVAVLAVVLVLLSAQKCSVRGEVQSITVLEPGEGRQQVMVKLLLEDGDVLYFRIGESAPVKNLNGNVVPPESLLEGDVIVITYLKRNGDDSIIDAVSAVFEKGA